MRKSFVMTAIALMTMLTGSNAMAENLQGRFAISGRTGLVIPADSERNRVGISEKVVVETDPGFIIGGGLFYGVDQHVALELAVDHSVFDAGSFGTAKVDTVSIGGQYRFNDRDYMVPYLAGGVDIIIPDFSDFDVDTVLGVHLAAGFDYFLNKNLAVTAELKGLQSFDTDIKDRTGKQGDFNPSNISTTLGIRVFFN